ncbi:MAG: hypothetical protein ACXVBW_11825 [Bdellovibrionota bacterium]
MRRFLGAAVIASLISTPAFAFDSVLTSVFPTGVVFPEFARAETLNPAGMDDQRAIAIQAQSGIPVNLPPVFSANSLPYSASIAAGFKNFGFGVDFGGTANTGAGGGLGTSTLSVGAAVKLDTFRVGLGMQYPVAISAGNGSLSSTPYLSLGTIIGGKSGLTGAIVIQNFTGNPMTSNFALGLGYKGKDNIWEFEGDLDTPSLSNFVSPNYTVRAGAGVYFWRLGVAANAAYAFGSLAGNGYNYAASGFSWGAGLTFWITKAFNFQLRYQLPQTTIGLEYAFE